MPNDASPLVDVLTICTAIPLQPCVGPNWLKRLGRRLLKGIDPYQPNAAPNRKFSLHIEKEIVMAAAAGNCRLLVDVMTFAANLGLTRRQVRRSVRVRACAFGFLRKCLLVAMTAKAWRVRRRRRWRTFLMTLRASQPRGAVRFDQQQRFIGEQPAAEDCRCCAHDQDRHRGFVCDHAAKVMPSSNASLERDQSRIMRGNSRSRESSSRSRRRNLSL